MVSDSDDQIDSEMQDSDDLIAELTERYVSGLNRGVDSLREIVDAHPALAPDLEKQLKFVAMLRFSGISASSVPPLDARKNKSEGLAPVATQKVTRVGCPHCGNNIRIVNDLHIIETKCLSCGSVVSLGDGSGGPSVEKVPGDRIGRFEIVRILGEGSFGKVYLAFDTELNRDVALKIPRTLSFLTPNRRGRFLREAKHAARLDHPGIVKVYDILNEDSLPIIVSAYVDGLTLKDQIMISEIGPRQAAEIISRLALAVDFAHNNGVVHRDIKPSNVLLNREGNPMVTDFGLAHDLEADITITSEGEVLGTPAYMSPEQASGAIGGASKLSDVYSLGVVLYQALTRVLPFRGSKRLLLDQILYDDPVTPSKIDKRVPKGLETIAAKAMSKDPHQRYASAAELSFDLQRWLDGKPIIAQPEPAISRTVKWAKRNPSLATAASVATGLLVALALLASVWAWRESSFANRISENLTESNRRLAVIYEQKAEPLLFQNQPFDALMWCRRLAKLEPSENSHRFRCAQIENSLPVLTDVWNVDGPVELTRTHPDGSRILCVFGSSNVAILDESSSTPRVTFEHPDAVQDAFFLPDRESLISRAANSLFVWDLATGRQKYKFDCPQYVLDVAVDRDGKYAAAMGYRGKVQIFSLADGGLVKTLDHPGERVYGMKVAFTSDGEQLLVSFSDIPTSNFLLYDCDSWATTKKLQNQAKSNLISLQISPDDKFFVATTQESVVIWHLDRDKPTREFPAAESFITSTFVSPDSLSVFVRDATGATTHLSPDTMDQGETFTGPAQHGVSRDSAISWDGRLIATPLLNGNIAIRRLNLSGEFCPRIPCHEVATSVDFHPQGHRLVAGNSSGSVRQWDLSGALAAQSWFFHDASVTGAEFNDDGSRIMTTGRDSTARIWDAASGEQFGPNLNHEKKDVTSGQFSSVQNIAVTAAGGKSVWLWDTKTGKPVGKPLVQNQEVTRAVFVEGDSRFAVVADKSPEVSLWDSKSRQLLFSVTHPRSAGVAEHISVAGSSKANMFATSSTAGTVQLWSLDDGKPTAKLIEGLSPWPKAEFSPDGSLLAAVGSKNEIQFWDVSDTRAPIQTLRLLSEPARFKFSRDGESLFVADNTGRLSSFKASAAGFQPSWSKDFELFPTALEIGPKDSVIAIAGSVPRDDTGAVWLVDANSGSLLSGVQQHPRRVDSLRFSPDQSALLYRSTFAAVLWKFTQPAKRDDAETGKRYEVLAGALIDEKNDLVAISPTDLVTAFDETIRSDSYFSKPSAQLLQSWQRLSEKVKALP